MKSNTVSRSVKMRELNLFQETSYGLCSIPNDNGNGNVEDDGDRWRRTTCKENYR